MGSQHRLFHASRTRLGAAIAVSSLLTSALLFGSGGSAAGAPVGYGYAFRAAPRSAVSGTSTPFQVQGAGANFVGHIVQWDGDTNPQKTAWLVGPDDNRRWISNISTYNCLKANGAPGPDVLSSSELDTLPNLNNVWAVCGADRIGVNSMLQQGFYARSQNGLYTLRLTSGNLTLTDPAGDVLWSTGLGGDDLTLQSGGNLVEYSNGAPVWASSTAGSGAAWLVVNNDGTLDLYNSAGAKVWTNTPAPAYVALGDSFTAGDGIKAQGWVNQSGAADGSPIANDGCDRSSEGYPELVDKWLGQQTTTLPPMSFAFLACSGATTTDVWSGSPSRQDGLLGATGDNGEGEQLSYSQLKNARIVTLTIGGNDFNFSDIIANCLDPLLHSCNAQSNDGWIADLARNIQTLKASLASTYQAIRNAAPGAAIYVLGYPAIFPAQPTGACQGLTKSAVTYLASMQAPLNQVIQAAANESGVHYVDPNAGPFSFVGHDVCQTSGSWIQGLSPFGSAASFHPNQQGQAAMAASLEAAMNSTLTAQPGMNGMKGRVIR